MKLKTEFVKASQKILIVDKQNHRLTQELKKELNKFDSEVFISPHRADNIDRFAYTFIINETAYPHKHFFDPKKKVIFVFLNKKKSADKYRQAAIFYKTKHIKIVSIEGNPQLSSDNLKNLLWFAFSDSEETYLTISQPLKTTYPKIHHEKKISFNIVGLLKFFSFRRVFFVVLIIFIAAHFLFVPFIALSSYFYYLSAKALQKDQSVISSDYQRKALSLYIKGRNLYFFPQQTLRLLSLSGPTDTLFEINDAIDSLLNQAVFLKESSQEISRLILKENKSPEEKKLLVNRFNQVKDHLDQINDKLLFLNQKIPASFDSLKKARNQISLGLELIQKGKKIFPYIDILLAKDTQKKYLLLFANNMEIRPGGGFIGSFGILTVKDYTLNKIDIYDVYDADGQLKAHVDPPEALAKYLNQPHWFLRDSAFSADFPENLLTAEFFLKKELGFEQFDGGILLTTSAVQNLLAAFDKIYLPDYNELITPENFYLKAQLYSEKNFFPGSTQKKSFLSALSRYVLQNLQEAYFPSLIQGVVKSLDEKQLVVSVGDTRIQEMLDNYYWSGKIIKPACPPNLTNCYADYLFPIDANLGVNKANFFINRSTEVSVQIDDQGFIHNTTIIKFKNSSPQNAFPGGTYHNYFQIYLPPGSQVNEITKNDVLVEDYTQSITDFRQVGFYFEVKPGQTVEIKVSYQSTIKLTKGRGFYQLLTQKQIGSSNNDMNIKIQLPKNVYLINQNFTPLVKDNLILYNTQLSTDKIFFVELLKE